MKCREVIFIGALVLGGFYSLNAASLPSWAETAGESSVPVEVETRTGLGGRLVYGARSLSQYGTSDGRGIVSIYSVALDEPAQWNSAAVEDGWHEISLAVDKEAQKVRLLVRNDAAYWMHGGRLTADETWDASQVHLIHHNVVVPSGVSLSIQEGAIMKFCEDTKLVVEEGGSLVVLGAAEAPVVFAHIANDTVGGDTVFSEGETTRNEYSVVVDGEASWNGYVCFLDCTEAVAGFHQLRLYDAVSLETSGEAVVRVELTGSRGTPVSVRWHAVAGTALFEEDYTLQEGTVSWGPSESGSQYIRIPLVSDDRVEGEEMFILELYDELGAVVTVRTCTVRILESGLHTEWTASATSSPVRVDDRRDFGGMLAYGSVVISPGGDTTAGIVELDGQVLAGSFVFDTTTLENGWHQARLKAVGETQETELAVLNDDSITIYGGRLETDETWNAATVHLVRDWVVVPSGKTLHIAAGTVVKFCTGAGLKIEKGGTLDIEEVEDEIVAFGHVANDNLGGDTDMQSVVAVPLDVWEFICEGAMTAGENVCVMDKTAFSDWASFALADAVVLRLDGTARVRLTLSGSRGIPVSVQWRAVLADQVVATGRASYSSNASGLQYLEVPLTEKYFAEPMTKFQIELFNPCGATLAGSSCRVTVFDGALHGAFVEADAPAVYMDTRETIGGQLACGMTYFSQLASEMSSKDVTLIGRKEQIVLKSTLYDTAKLTDGWYTARYGETGEKKAIMVMNAPEVAIHGGRLAVDETWEPDKTHLVRNWVVVPAGTTLTLLP